MSKLIKRISDNPIVPLLVLSSLVFPIAVITYSLLFSANIPQQDTFVISIPIAVAARNGTLTLGDLIQPLYGIHRILFSNLLTALLTYTTGWNVAIETYFNIVLALVIHIFLLRLIWRLHRELFWIFLVPVSALVWSLQQYNNWILSTHTCVHWVGLFFLASLLTLSEKPRGWRNIFPAAFFVLCSNFSWTNGLVTGFILLPALWFFGYRKWSYILFWVTVSLLGAALYMLTPPHIDLEIAVRGGGVSTIGLNRLTEYIYFALVYLGGFLSEEIGSAAWLGASGLGIFLINVIYLSTRKDERETVATWVAVAGYTIGSGFMTSIGRVIGPDISWALRDYFGAPVSLFWVALLALSLVATRHILKGKETNRARTLLAYLNITFVLALIPAYTSEVRDVLNMTALTRMSLDTSEYCVLYFPLSRNEECWHPPYPNHLDELAAHDLSIFAHRHPTAALPAVFTPEDPVVVETSSGYYNYHISRWILTDVDSTLQYHLVPPDQQDLIDTAMLPTDIQTLPISDQTASQVLAIAEQSSRIWYIQEIGQPGTGSGLEETLSDQYILFHYSQIEGTPLVLTGYRPGSQAQSDPFVYFGDHIGLHMWALEESVQVEPCQTITVESVWSSDQPLNVDYRLTLVMVDDTGQGIARTDGGPSATPMPSWEPGHRYLDGRTLTIPCDVQPGDYPLMLGIYTPLDVENIPVTLPDGTPLGDLLYLTTLFVIDTTVD